MTYKSINKTVYTVIGILIFCIFSCNRDIKRFNSKLGYCNRIDTLVLEHKVWETGNYYTNKIIPILEKESNIVSKAEKGFTGFLYRNDSLFYSDIALWKNYFNCK